MRAIQAQREVGGRLTVGVADMILSADRSASIITYALGSCIGITVYDPVAHIGGMLHFMLPSSKTNEEKGRKNPAMFADTGVPRLFTEAYALGGVKERLIVVAAGGAEVLEDDGHFKIGSRNRTMLRKILWKNSVLLGADDTGGSQSRTMELRLEDGAVVIRSKGKETVLWKP